MKKDNDLDIIKVATDQNEFSQYYNVLPRNNVDYGRELDLDNIQEKLEDK